MARTRIPLLLLGLAAPAIGCSSTTVVPPKPIENVAIPVKDTTPKPKHVVTRESPPPSAPPADYHFPAVTWSELKNGLQVATIQSKALPVVQIRVVVQAGKAAEGEHPGVADLTAELMKAGGAGPMNGRDLVTKVETLGSSLGVETGFDKTVFSMAVTKDHAAEAMSLLGTLVSAPRFDAGEFAKLKKRELDRVADSARTSGRWAASVVLFRDLYSLPTDHHPYANFDVTPDEMQKLTLQDCRAFHKAEYMAKNAFVVVAGDIAPDEAKALADKAFGGMATGEAKPVSFTDPMPPEHLTITLIDRPKSSQSDIYVGLLGPQRSDPEWASFAVANQVLGGGVSGRLFLDIREKQSLAYNTRSSLTELAHGPAPLLAYAGTQTAKTGVALKGLLDNLDQLAKSAPSNDEIATATRYLSDVFAIKLETVGALADELVHLHTLGLPDDYDDGYRKQLREVSADAAGKVAAEHVREGHAVVAVAGDADVIGPMLSHFGEVKVVDPMNNFARKRTIPMNAQAPLEVPREAGR